MDTNQLLELILHELKEIKHNLEINVAAPSYQYALEEFAQFDWTLIGAKIVTIDKEGVSCVRWCGNYYFRRTSDDSDKSILFSIVIGKNDYGKNQYQDLIEFKQMIEEKESTWGFTLGTIPTRN